ncbi:4F5 protein family [Musa troglodytarum]|uniref:4F5 protein family n=1 Tax=Musa troglodytarum TaxID=320322 RepID=A0A9E7H282_9LILI|nr:4F5 protein family [Musa troglodytarum]
MSKGKVFEEARVKLNAYTKDFCCSRISTLSVFFILIGSFEIPITGKTPPHLPLYGPLFRLLFSSWGNQREVDRRRAQARKSQVKQRDDGLTAEQRRERDAKALQEKAAKKAAQAAGGTIDSKNKGNAKK